MKLDERTKERINNYFNGISSEQAYELAIKYNIVEAINWGNTQGQSLPIDSVSQQRELLVAYEKRHYTPSEWALASEQCEKEIDDFLATNCG